MPGYPVTDADDFVAAMARLDIHDHACLIHDDREMLIETIVAYISAGFAAGDRCVCFDDALPPETVLAALRDAGVPTEKALEDGQLVLADTVPPSGAEGDDDLDRAFAFMHRLADETPALGYRALRCIGEFGLTPQDRMSFDVLADYETRIKHFYRTRQCLGLRPCRIGQYPPAMLRGIIMAHPLVIHKRRVCRNPCFLGDDAADGSMAELLDRLDAWETDLDAVEKLHRTSDSLENATAELGAIYANAPVAMLLIDGNRQVRKANHAAALFSGRPREAMVGLRGGEAINCLNRLSDPQGCGHGPQCEQCILRRNVIDTLEHHTVHANEEAWIPVEGPDGEQLCGLLFSTSPLRLDGEDMALLCAQDITETRETQRQLLASEKRYRLILEASPLCVFVLRGDRYLYVNPAAAKTLGYAGADELIDQPAENAIDDAQIADVRKRMEQAMAGLANPTMVLGMRRADGSKIIMESTSVPITLTDGQAILVMSHDITDRIEALRALDESEQRFRSILDTINLYAVILDEQGRINYANPCLCKAVGMTSKHLAGKNWFDTVMPDADREQIRRFFHDSLGQNEMATMRDGCIVAADGGTRLVSWSNVVLHDISGKPIGTASVGQDVTEHRRLEQQYMQAQKMEAVGRLAAGVAHDFNNQLTVIQGYCEMLMLGRGPDDPQWKALSEIHNATQRAHATTSHLLSFSRRQILKPETICVNELLKSIRGPVGKMIGEDIRLTVITEPGLPPVFIDRPGLHQALMNLIVNARDAMPTGGELILRSDTLTLDEATAGEFPGAPHGPYVRIEVADTGSGMDPATLEKLFEPFFTTKDVGKGTGLGLPMVEGFIRQSNGYLSVWSEPGQGASFRLLLPPCGQESGQDPVDEVETDKNAPGGAETLLLVEDEHSVRGMMVSALRNFGYAICEAASPAEAIAIAQSSQGRIDLLITDMVMPGMSGRDLAAKLTAACDKLKVLFVTGYTSEDVSQGGTNILQKPFTADKLIRAVRRILDGESLGGPTV